jgi:uncharacterized protein YgbK (DUF1537 family)
MPQILIIADDLTGAADTGATFARAGWLTLVDLDSAAPIPGSDALVLSTESRDLTREEAVAKVRQATRYTLRQQQATEIPYVYKKIDSTLRGHPAPELGAAMGALGLERALVAPAFPAQGRTTIDGRQLVDHVPVEETTFADGIPYSDLPALFQDQSKGEPVGRIDLPTVRGGPAAIIEVLDLVGAGLVIADAETDADLVAIARAGLRCGVRLWCGSAGLAGALAAVLPRPEPTRPVPGPLPRPHGPTLVVAGSRHPRTVRQVEVAQGWGAVVVHPSPGILSGDAQAIERTIKRASRHLGDDEHVILSTAGMGDSPLGGQAMATVLAQVVRRLTTQSHVGGNFLTGGAIAAAVCAELKASAIWLRGETQPGIPWGVLLGGLCPGLPVVTKAGGFGTDAALAVAIRRLEDWKAGKLDVW